MLLSTTTQPPTQESDTENPITVEGISEFWFLILALVSIVAFLVRLKLEVSENKERLKKIENEMIPVINKDLDLTKASIDSRLQDTRGLFAVELKSALQSQREFIQSRFDLILEKLSSRDSTISALKEQADRQGKELREITGYRKYMEKDRTTD